MKCRGRKGGGGSSHLTSVSELGTPLFFKRKVVLKDTTKELASGIHQSAASKARSEMFVTGDT